MILQLDAAYTIIVDTMEIALMTTLSRVKNDVIQNIRTIQKEFIREFLNINANQYTALLDHNDALMGVGVSKMSALAHAEMNLGYVAITNLFVKGCLTEMRLTEGDFEMLVDEPSNIEDLLKIGDLFLSAHFVNSIKKTVEHIDALLKQVDLNNAFTFKIRPRDTDDNEPRVFAFEMNFDGGHFDGGFVKRAVIQQGPWLSVIPDLMSIKNCFLNHSAQQRLNKGKGVHL